jgi:hypothetical protein
VTLSQPQKTKKMKKMNKGQKIILSIILITLSVVLIVGVVVISLGDAFYTKTVNIEDAPEQFTILHKLQRDYISVSIPPEFFFVTDNGLAIDVSYKVWEYCEINSTVTKQQILDLEQTLPDPKLSIEFFAVLYGLIGALGLIIFIITQKEKKDEK